MKRRLLYPVVNGLYAALRFVSTDRVLDTRIGDAFHSWAYELIADLEIALFCPKAVL